MEFEASVAGGIPILRTIKEGLATNKINKIYGILNGTCNYILSEMEKTKDDFSNVLKKALGYCLVIKISLLINLKSECISCDFFPSSKQDKAGTFL